MIGTFYCHQDDYGHTLRGVLRVDINKFQWVRGGALRGKVTQGCEQRLREALERRFWRWLGAA